MKTSLYHIFGICLATLKFYQPFIVSIIGFILAIGLIRIIFTFIRTFIAGKKLVVTVTPKIVQRLSLKHNIHNRVKVVSSRRPFAFCLGLINPNIYISTSLIKIMKASELEAILLHEKHHLLNRDNFSILFLDFMKQIFAFFPLATDFINNLIIDKEIKADAYVINVLQKTKPISNAFKKLLQYENTPVFALQYLPTFTNSTHMMETRINALLGKKQPLLSINIKSLIISISSLVIFGFLFIFPWQNIQAKQTHKTPTVCLKGISCNDNC